MALQVAHPPPQNFTVQVLGQEPGELALPAAGRTVKEEVHVHDALLLSLAKVLIQTFEPTDHGVEVPFDVQSLDGVALLDAVLVDAIFTRIQKSLVGLQEHLHYASKIPCGFQVRLHRFFYGQVDSSRAGIVPGGHLLDDRPA